MKEFAPKGSEMSFRVDRFSKWRQHNFDIVTSPESVSDPLKDKQKEGKNMSFLSIRSEGLFSGWGMSDTRGGREISGLFMLLSFQDQLPTHIIHERRLHCLAYRSFYFQLEVCAHKV